VSGVDELTGVHAFHGDEVLSALLVFVHVSENNLGKGSTTSSIVNNVSHYTLDVSAEIGLVSITNQRAYLAWARHCAANT
jgi:hypothetical protein